MPPIKLPELDLKQLEIKPSLVEKGAPAMVPSQFTPGSQSDSFDSDWWPWVFVGAVTVFGLSMMVGYVSGRRPA
jgi:hypothetical protein